MAKTLWDINFSTLDTTQSNYNGWATKATNTLNLATGVYNPNGSRLFVNAVDIDWNGATLDSTVINTTGDLLKYIKAKSNLTLGTTSTTAAAGNHTHSNYLTKVLKLEKTGTSTIDLLASTTYTLTVGDQKLQFKTPSGGTNVTVTDGSNALSWNTNVTLATVDGVAIDAKLPANPVTTTAIANLGFTKNEGTVTKVKVGNTEYSPSSGVVSIPAYPTVTTYSQATSSTLGLIKIGFSQSGKNYPVQLNSSGQAYVNVPWTDTDTTYTQGTNITISSNTISHATPTAKTNIKGNKTTQLLATITTDSQGHVTDYDIITPEELANLLKPYAKAYFDTIYEPKSTTVAVTGISLDKSSLEVAANGTGSITATITPSNATNKNVTWTSSDTSVATVTASTTSGNATTVTWKKAGTCTITATAAGNTSKTAQCSVTCKSATVAVTGISLDKSSLEVAANGTGTIIATITPSNATNKNVTWTSSDTSVATVTASTTSGNAATVTWKKAGTCTITATAAGNTSKTAQCSITCKSTTTYYWYAGQTQPSTMSSNPTVDDTNFTVNKWHTLGSTGSTNTTISKTVTGGTVGTNWYIAAPNGFIATTSDLSTPDTSMTKLSNITISGQSYVVYKSNTTPAKFSVYMKK